jgi:hypothetical protein
MPGGGDPMALIEELLLQLKMKERQGARSEHLAATQALEAAINAKVAEMFEKADDIFTAGLLSGLGQCVSGAGSLAGGGFGLAELASSKATEVAVSSASQLNSVFSGGGQLLGGVSQIGSAAYDGVVSEDEARIARCEGEQSTEEFAANQSQEDANAARDDFRALLDKIEQIRQSEIASRTAALFRA